MHTYILRHLVVLAACASVTRGQSLVGAQSGATLEHFGSAVISAGFQNADTYGDLLVGAPSAGTGKIYCVSGLNLATGTGPSTLWSVTGPVNPPAVTGGSFGAAIAAVGDLTGDSVTDFVVGAPDYHFNPFGPVNGAVHLVDGSTHTVVATIYGANDTRLGAVIVSVGDQNGDGKTEIAVTAQATNTSQASFVHVIQGSAFSGTKSLANAAHSGFNVNGANEFGETLAGNFDLDGNGKKDLAIGCPRMFSGGLMVVVTADNQFTVLATYNGANALERMASSISATHDYNGDGVVDFVVGAPNWSTTHSTADGRAVVLSGLKLRTFTLPYELATFALTTGGVATFRFGAEVKASPDLDRDGVGDFLIGAPAYHSLFPAGQPNRGAVFVYSGATLSNIESIYGVTGDTNFGAEILGGFQDVTGDFFPEFVMAAPASDNPNFDGGVIKLYSLFPIAPFTYCVGKVNSQGCTPTCSWNGTASVSSTARFTLNCANAINHVFGLLFYSHGPGSTPFQGGTHCVQTPTKRTSVLDSGGSASGTDCTGVFTYDFNALIGSGIDPTLTTGAQIFAQFWSRDSASPSTTSLSNAVHFWINP